MFRVDIFGKSGYFWKKYNTFFRMSPPPPQLGLEIAQGTSFSTTRENTPKRGALIIRCSNYKEMPYNSVHVQE